MLNNLMLKFTKGFITAHGFKTNSGAYLFSKFNLYIAYFLYGFFYFFLVIASCNQDMPNINVYNFIIITSNENNN